MTRRELTQTNLIIGILYPLYMMQEEDIEALAADLSKQVRIEYNKTIAAQLVLYRCQRPATGPDTESQRWMDGYVKTSSEGIAKTYNRELKNEIQRLYDKNPRGNRAYFYKNLDAWTIRRNSYKVPSIGLNTLTAAREYAQKRFVKENGIEGRWVFTGPPPVCRICMRIKALGVVDLKATEKNPLPAHVNCPHRWSQLIPQVIECSDETWTG